MRLFKALTLLVCASVIFLGCVSSKEYKARLGEIEELNGTLAGVRGELAAAEARESALRDEVATLTEERDRLVAVRDTLERENLALKNAADRSTLELTGEITDLQDELSGRDLRIQNLQERIADLEEELEEREMMLEGTVAELDLLRERERARAREAEQAVSQMKDTYEALVSELNREIEQGRIAVTRLQDKLSLSMVDRILFDSGSATVNAEGRKVLDRVANVLRTVMDRQIMVEGHTDDVPIGPKLAETFPTNWELSSRRATNVVRYLQDKGDIDPRFLAAAGLAQYKPVASNETEEGRARNRRIEIILVPLDRPEEAAAEPGTGIGDSGEDAAPSGTGTAEPGESSSEEGSSEGQ